MGTAASGMDESAVLSRTRQNNFTVLVRLHSDFILRHEKLPLTQRFQHVGGCRETEAHQKLLFTSRVALQDGIDHVWSLRKIKRQTNRGLVSQKVTQVFIPTTDTINKSDWLFNKEELSLLIIFLFHTFSGNLSLKVSHYTKCTFQMFMNCINTFFGSYKMLRCSSTAAKVEKWGCETG